MLVIIKKVLNLAEGWEKERGGGEEREIRWDRRREGRQRSFF